MEQNKFQFSRSGFNGTLIYNLSEGEMISRFDDGMLMNNNIEGILGYTYRRSEQSSMLMYNILRGTRLSLIRSNGLNKRLALSVLRGITEVLATAEEYMLDESKFIFADDFIYADTARNSIYLVYIPTDQFHGQSFVQYVKGFIVDGVFDMSENTGYLTTILNYINANPGCSARELGGLFGTILGAEAQPASVVQPDMSRQGQNVLPTAPPVQNVQVPPAPRAAQIPASAYPMLSAVPDIPPRPKKRAEKKQEKKGSLFGLFGGKSEQPKEMPVMPGMPGMNIPGMPTRAPAGNPKPHINKDSTKAPTPPANAVQPTGQMNYAPPVQPVAETLPVQLPPEESDKTTMLKPGGNSPAGIVTAYLISGRGERIAITKSDFTVGKENKLGIANDYIIKNPSVSRNHAIIKIKNGRYYIIDMTSLNGTFINGSRICGNAEIEIHSGDKIMFADEGYEFRIE